MKKGMMPKTRKARSPHRTLFGLREVVEKTEKVASIIVVEGELDSIYLQQFGIPAVANMGTSPMGAEKIRLLRRHTGKVVLSYDGDEAGHRAMFGDGKRRGALEVLSKYISTVAVHLPDGLDPNALTPEQVEEIYGEWREHV
jgi:DNA primase